MFGTIKTLIQKQEPAPLKTLSSKHTLQELQRAITGLELLELKNLLNGAFLKYAEEKNNVNKSRSGATSDSTIGIATHENNVKRLNLLNSKINYIEEKIRLLQIEEEKRLLQNEDTKIGHD
jgi:hypothetical protein